MIAYILHAVLGYGIVNGILYAPIYFWAFILLISYGIDYTYNKLQQKKLYIILVIILISTLAVYNYGWLTDINKCLKNEEFNTDIKYNTKTYMYIDNDKYSESFFFNGKSLYRVRDAKKILDDIDVCKLSQNENCIVGLLNDSNWFKVYFQDNKLKVNISEQVQEVNNEEFFIFGMGLREKFILTIQGNDKYRLIQYSNKKDIINNLELDKIDYINYTAYLKKDNDIIKIYENENGIYMDVNGITTILDDSIKVNIPDFNEYEHEEELRMLFNEVMVNVTEDGPKPNFIAYDKVWYRDAASVAMFLKETDNLDHIKNWLNNISKIYDEQNGEKEVDNLGQVLYLLSLSDYKNQKLIDEILNEAENLKTEQGYIQGVTDGSIHPIYQTKWLIYGMKSLGIDYSEYAVPEIEDSYSNLMWFDREKDKGKLNLRDRWQYLYFANLHYNKVKIEYKHTKYPISNEIMPAKADFENMNIINKNYEEAKIVAPHSWAASEMFLYLLDLDRGNI